MTILSYDQNNFLRKCIVLRLNNEYISIKRIIHLHIMQKEVLENKKIINLPLLTLKFIGESKSFATFAKNSIASFKIRKDVVMGTKTTIKKSNFIEHFNYKLKNTILPNVHELASIFYKNIDNNYNYNMGLNDITIYPEIYNSFDYFYKSLGINYVFKNIYFKSYKLISKLQLNISEFPLNIN